MIKESLNIIQEWLDELASNPDDYNTKKIALDIFNTIMGNGRDCPHSKDIWCRMADSCKDCPMKLTQDYICRGAHTCQLSDCKHYLPHKYSHLCELSCHTLTPPSCIQWRFNAQ